MPLHLIRNDKNFCKISLKILNLTKKLQSSSIIICNYSCYNNDKHNISNIYGHLNRNGHNMNNMIRLFHMTTILECNIRKKHENYYDILQVKPDCSQEEIRNAYIMLCKKFHPDKLKNNNNDNEQKQIEDTAHFQKINEAYDCLSKTDKRNQYDLSIRFNPGMNPFMKTRSNNFNNNHNYYYYHHQPPPYNHNPFDNYYTHNYYQNMRREFMRHQQRQQQEGFADIKGELFGTKFTVFMLLTLVITIILQIRLYILWKESFSRKNQRVDHVIRELYEK